MQIAASPQTPPQTAQEIMAIHYPELDPPMERDPLNVELDDLKDFRAWVRKHATQIDTVLRNDDTSSEVKFYYFGLFMAELARRTGVDG